MSKYEDKRQLKCSFCGKNQEQVRRLIAGPNVYICDECVELCDEIIQEEVEEITEEEVINLPKPKEMMNTLNDYVIGQEKAKKALSVAVYIIITKEFMEKIKDLIKMLKFKRVIYYY